MAKKKDLLEQSSTELKATVDHALSAVAGIKEGLGEMVSLTKEDRKTQSRFRSGEAEALEGVLDVAAANPAPFSVLAPSDGGHDLGVFEIDLLRADRVRAKGRLPRECAAPS